jgi:hypothetical protein
VVGAGPLCSSDAKDVQGRTVACPSTVNVHKSAAPSGDSLSKHFRPCWFVSPNGTIPKHVITNS